MARLKHPCNGTSMTVTRVTKKKPQSNEVATRLTLIEKFDAGTVGSQAKEAEDDFQGMYYDGTTNGAGRVIKPTYDFARLQALVTENNALLSCITAMEVNIDGTGYDIKMADGDETPSPDMEKRIKSIKEFFDNPYPRKSFVTIRRTLRVDLEGTGNAYLEVIRNLAGLIIYIRRINPKTMRMLRLGEAMPSTKTVIRNGKSFDITLMDRPRAFVQKINNKLTYFKEYGTQYHINMITGDWDNINQVPLDLRGNEVIHFTMIEDDKTPYGLPRWINQIPSIVGSRNAEEYNLEFFDNGGIPPVIISVSGGIIAEESKKELDKVLKGGAKTKMRGAVIETHAMGGDLSTAGKVDVKVERFGNEQTKDSMFEGYDEKCENRVRSSFRLPPLFVGKATDYSYATAYASYAIGEAQVFKPERLEFDEIINKTIMQELDADLVLKSKPLTIDNSDIQLKAVEIAAANMVISGENLVGILNNMTNLSLEYDEASTLPGRTMGQQLQGQAKPDNVQAVGLPNQVIKSESNPYLEQLATKWVSAYGFDGSVGSQHQANLLKAQVDGLIDQEKNLFNKLVAVRVLSDITNDVQGCADLCECATHVTGG
jgi:PBSX family phage portal protein